MEIEQFCRLLPKLELHAHLNGSLSEATLKNLGCLDNNIQEYQKLTTLLNTTEKTLEDCFELFKVARNATSNKESLYFATKSVIKDFYNDNVVYLELRTTPRCENDMSKADYIETVVKSILDNELKIIVKLLLSIDRRHDFQTSQESIDLFITMKRKYPNIIKGVDLSGNPSSGHFHPNLFKKAIENDLFLTLHCAEVKNNEEAMEMLAFQPHRIGHGTALHPNYGGSEDTWKAYCRKPIPLECCLTSNVVCGTSRGYKDHHLQEWLKHSLPFSLNTDDKGVFCTTLSKEFEIAAKAFHLTPTNLWEISYRTIDYTFASQGEKSSLKETLQNWRITHHF